MNLAEVSKALSYQDYLQLLDQVVEKNKTTGPVQSEELAHYTKLNKQRISRIHKTTKVSKEVDQVKNKISKPLTAIALTEGWCGDAAQILPIFFEIAKSIGEKLEIRVLLRDENLEIMDQYLTNGGRSIPKIVLFDQNSGKELGSWGPRPMQAQDLYVDLREKNVVKEEAIFAMQKWYIADKGNQVQAELIQFITECITKNEQ
jgi:hypothetical protein